MIKDIKWKPKYGEKYYYIDISGLGGLLIANMNEEINRESFINLTSDYYRCAWREGDDDYINLFHGNVFKTEKEAELYRDKIIDWMLENDAIWKLESKEGFQFKKFS